MRKYEIAGLIVAGFALGLSGCGSGGSGYVPKPVIKVPETKLAAGEDKSLFPLVVGNTWVYSSSVVVQTNGRQGKNDSELTFTVKSVEDVGGGRKALVEISNNGKVSEKQYWLVNDKGIYQASAGPAGTAFNPPQLAVVFPPEANKEFKWEGTGLLPGGGEGMSKSTGKVLGPQEVDTDLGRLSAIAVETQQQWTKAGKEGRAVSTVWWAPKIGIVRFYQEIGTAEVQASQTLRLKSKTVKE